jgi:hypothetical protein
MGRRFGAASGGLCLTGIGSTLLPVVVCPPPAALPNRPRFPTDSLSGPRRRNPRWGPSPDALSRPRAALARRRLTRADASIFTLPSYD